MEMKENQSNDSTFESIKNLTEKDAKTILNLIYSTLKDNETPSDKLVSNVISIYENKIPRLIRARQKND